MTRKRLPAVLLGIVLFCALVAARHTISPARPAATAVELYNSMFGTLPGVQGWTYVALNGDSALTLPLATQTYSNGVTLLDTMPTALDLAGYSITTTTNLTLDRSLGYRLIFATQVITEAHAGSDRNGDNVDDRAGWSLTVIGADKRGIELGFWPDRIWAQEGGTAPQLFTQAEGVAVSTTNSLKVYTLTVLNDTYTLSANSTDILTGSLRDYAAFGGPYETPNLISLSDNTTSARAYARLASVVLERLAPPLYNRVYLPLIRK